MGLNSRQGGGGDLPSLDLAFALDKTLTPRKGPMPDFTRVQATSTGSTYVGADRLIKYAAANEPRFDHDPATGASKGLLIEESKTNLMARSEEFNQSPWSSSLITITQDDGVSPDGLTTAESFLFTGVGNVVQTAVMGSTAPTATFSFFVKAKTGAGFTRIIIGNGTSPTNFFGGWFNLSTGLWGTSAIGGTATLVGTSVTNFNNGWYRISITGSVSGASSYTPFLYITDSDNSTVRSTTVSQLWWGAQLEAGTFPTSYIPTTSGTAARSADVCSIIGTDFSSFYNQSEGTISKQVYAANGLGSTTQFPFGFSDGTTANQLSIFRATDDPRKFGFFSNTNNVGTPTSPIRTDIINDREYGALAWAFKQNDMGGVFKGQLYTDTTITIPSVNQLHIGNRFDGARPWNGHIARIQYFRKRLSNAKLQTITTP